MNITWLINLRPGLKIFQKEYQRKSENIFIRRNKACNIPAHGVIFSVDVINYTRVASIYLPLCCHRYAKILCERVNSNSLKFRSDIVRDHLFFFFYRSFPNYALLYTVDEYLKSVSSCSGVIIIDAFDDSFSDTGDVVIRGPRNVLSAPDRVRSPENSGP